MLQYIILHYLNVSALSPFAVGPDTPIVDGPTVAETGSYADFTCSAMSEPSSYYTWWFNHETMTANTSVFTAGPLSLNMSGEYTCMAHNHVTGRNSTNSITLRVIGMMTQLWQELD